MDLKTAVPALLLSAAVPSAGVAADGHTLEQQDCLTKVFEAHLPNLGPVSIGLSDDFIVATASNGISDITVRHFAEMGFTGIVVKDNASGQESSANWNGSAFAYDGDKTKVEAVAGPVVACFGD